jgi:hypothetical protein
MSSDAGQLITTTMGIHLVPYEGGGIQFFNMSWSFAIGALDGDWFSAAEVYRSWYVRLVDWVCALSCLCNAVVSVLLLLLLLVLLLLLTVVLFCDGRALQQAAWTQAGPIAHRADFPKWLLGNNVWLNTGWQFHDVCRFSERLCLVLSRLPPYSFLSHTLA